MYIGKKASLGSRVRSYCPRDDGGTAAVVSSRAQRLFRWCLCVYIIQGMARVSHVVGYC